MYLFLGIGLITLLLNFCQTILKIFPVSSCFFRYEEDTATLKQVESLKHDLKELEETELDSYTNIVRRLRVENKIEELRKKLKVDKDYNKLKGASVERLLGYIVKAVLLIVLATISIKYSGILMFPTGIQNSISVPFWVLSCNLTFRWFRNILKGK